MNQQSPPPPKRLVVPIDFSALSLRALEYATSLYGRVPGVQIHLVHVVTSIPISRAFLSGEADRRATALLGDVQRAVQSKLEALVGDVRARAGAVRAETRFSMAAYAAILEYAADCAADLIVLGSHGRNALRYVFLGSVAGKVAHHARCSVLVIRPDQPGFVTEQGDVRLERILVPTDFSVAAAAAGPVAADLQSRFGADVRACYVDDGSPAELPPAAADWIPGVAATDAVRCTGRAGREIVRLAQEQRTDLIVMGAHGRHDGAPLLGTVSERVLRRAPCAVYLARTIEPEQRRLSP